MSTPLDSTLQQTIDALARAADALSALARSVENEALCPASAPPTDFRMSEIAQGAPAPTGASTGPQRGEEPTGATLAPDCRDIATATPAPSSPRRWWDGCVTVVEASAYDAAVRERDGWMDAVAEESRNADFYRDLVRQIGAHFGVAARTSDDGSVQDSVLALKVPELVAALIAERDAARAELAEAKQKLAEAEGRCVARCRAARDDEASRFAPALQEARLARRLTPDVLERAVATYWKHNGSVRDAIHAALLAAGFQEVAP